MTTTTTITTKTTARRRRGVSLIEVMIAAALLGIGITAILSAFSAYTNIVAHQRHLLDAAFVAQSSLQRLLTLPSTHADLSSGTHGPIVVDQTNTPTATGRFRVSWIVTPNKPTKHSREVRVLIGFQGDKTFELVGLQP